jgi:16S rRNA (cytidine1402-2'-O)-methyltransferase
MALYLVATPIGNPQDLSFRALETLKKADVIIVEEFKESTIILRAHGIVGKKLESLNEHSRAEDLKHLTDLAEKNEVALISDCGTPGFCDPGAHLVELCRKRKIKIVTIPGPSSLMALLSLSSQRLDHFNFVGFLPAESSRRGKAWSDLKKDPQASVIMDTPYRFQKTLQELSQSLPDRNCLVAINLTQETEQVVEGKAKEVLQFSQWPQKAEFLILIYPG